MDYAEAIDVGCAPEIFITGICKIERIGPGTVRFSFYSQRPEGNIVVLHTIWDMRTWLASSDMLENARDLLKRIPVVEAPRKEVH